MAPGHFVLSPSIKHYHIIIKRNQMYNDDIPVIDKCLSYVILKIVFLNYSRWEMSVVCIKIQLSSWYAYVWITERLFIHTVVNVWSVKKYLNQALICFKLFVYLSFFKVIFAWISINRRQRNKNESIMRSFHSFKQRDYSYWFVKKNTGNLIIFLACYDQNLYSVIKN